MEKRFNNGDYVATKDGADGTIRDSIRNVKTGYRYLVDFGSHKLWLPDDFLLTADDLMADEGYRCRSCDAILGSSPRPCPRCDGLPGYGNEAYHAECEEDLRLHEENWGQRAFFEDTSYHA